MQPEQPQTPSSEPAPDASAPETPSEQVEQPSRGSWFLQRLWRGRTGRFEGSGSDQAEEESQPQPTSPTLTLTQEELDRRVQAETDRREHKRQQEAAAERKRKLRDEDPWAYAEEERNAERVAATDAVNTQFLGNIGATHDRYTIDPLFEAVPAADQQRILALEGAGVGLDGRKLIVSESLKALEKKWKADGAKDAEDRLRRNPAFRKQVLNEFRRGMTEPEFIGSGAPSASDHSVSNILRDQLRARQS